MQKGLQLAILANDLDFTVMQYSTDYVFDGKNKRPDVEDDKNNPLNVCGVAKLAGEYLVSA